MRSVHAMLCVVAAAALVTACAPDRNIELTQDPQARLQAGNERFVQGHAWHPHEDAARRHDVFEHGQHPFATVLACSDSRVPVELLFDQGVGDIFVIRVAGNVVGDDETGSIEYAIEHLHCPLLVVLGHTSCGAVTAAVEHAPDTPSIETLLRHIEPAVHRAREATGNHDGDIVVNAAVRENVWQSMADLFDISGIARELIRDGKLEVVGAIYDIDSGEVSWLGGHPDQDRLVRR